MRNSQPDLTDYSYLIERQLKPESRKDIVELLKEMEVKPTSMIDISDGLSSEILHLCTQSKVGCDLYEDKIPLDPQVISTCEEFDLNRLANGAPGACPLQPACKPGRLTFASLGSISS